MKLFHKEPKAEQPYAVCVPGQHPKAGDAFRVNIAGEYVVRGKEGESLTARLGKTEGGKPFVVLSHLLCQKEGSDELLFGLQMVPSMQRIHGIMAHMRVTMIIARPI